MQLQQMYQEIILDHYRNPHGAGLKEPFDAESFQVNPTCGDEVTLRVVIEPGESGDPAAATVAGISHDSQGCSISQAATSVLTDLLVGRTVAQAREIYDAFREMVQSRGTISGDEDVIGDGIAFAGVSKYPARVKCALLGWMAYQDAVGRALDRSGSRTAHGS